MGLNKTARVSRPLDGDYYQIFLITTPTAAITLIFTSENLI